MGWFRCGSNGSAGEVIITPKQITDISGFTKLYDTSSEVNYGSLGSRVSDALGLTNEGTIASYMAEGWNSLHACFYDSENKIGAYAGYNFGKEIYIDKIDLYIGKYINQNKTLLATIQWLDSSNNWNDLQDLSVSGDIPYPLNYFSVHLGLKCYGVRWIHKNGEYKTSGNNIVFFGMLLFEYTGITETSKVFSYDDTMSIDANGYITNNSVMAIAPIESNSAIAKNINVDSSKSWFIGLKFRLSSLPSSTKLLIGNRKNNSYYDTPSIEISGNGSSIIGRCSTNGNSWTHSITINRQLSISTWYYIELSWNGSDMLLFELKDENGSIFESQSMAMNSAAVFSGLLGLGCIKQEAQFIASMIQFDVEKCSIKNDGAELWNISFSAEH